MKFWFLIDGKIVSKDRRPRFLIRTINAQYMKYKKQRSKMIKQDMLIDKL